MTEARSRHCSRCQQSYPLTDEFFKRRTDRRHLHRSFCRECDRTPRTGPRPSLIVDGQKRCKECEEWLPATAEYFHQNKQGERVYLRSYCKPCSTARHGEWASANRGLVRAAAKRSYDKHSAVRVAREMDRDRRLRSNPETADARRKQFRDWAAKRRKDPVRLERMRAWDRQYAKTDKGSARYTRRRGRLAQAEGHYTKSDVRRIAERQGFRCYWCEADIESRFVADHYIPLSRGGSNYPSNIVAACNPCNCRKHNKMPEEFLAQLKRASSTKSRRPSPAHSTESS